jgi:hypothetical protein
MSTRQRGNSMDDPLLFQPEDYVVVETSEEIVLARVISVKVETRCLIVKNLGSGKTYEVPEESCRLLDRLSRPTSNNSQVDV